MRAGGCRGVDALAEWCSGRRRSCHCAPGPVARRRGETGPGERSFTLAGPSALGIPSYCSSSELRCLPARQSDPSCQRPNSLGSAPRILWLVVGRRRCTPTLRVSERQPCCSHPHDHKPHGHRQSPCRERPGRPHPPRRVPPPPPDPLRIALASRGWFCPRRTWLVRRAHPSGTQASRQSGDGRASNLVDPRSRLAGRRRGRHHLCRSYHRIQVPDTGAERSRRAPACVPPCAPDR